MRDYQTAWDKLKLDKVVSITANRVLHARIIKAIKKEKWMDVGYKLEIEPAVAILSHSRSYSIITFRLDVRFRLDFRVRPQLTDKDFE